jgi:hypothetical protein
MCTNRWCLFFMIIMTFGCNAHLTTQAAINHEQKQAPQVHVPLVEKDINISWDFVKKEDGGEGMPTTEIYLLFENYKHEGAHRVFLTEEEGWPMRTEVEHGNLLHCSLWYAGAGSDVYISKDGSNLVVERQLTMEPPIDNEEEFEMPGPTRVKVFTLPSDRKVVPRDE